MKTLLLGLTLMSSISTFAAVDNVATVSSYESTDCAHIWNRIYLRLGNKSVEENKSQELNQSVELNNCIASEDPFVLEENDRKSILVSPKSEMTGREWNMFGDKLCKSMGHQELDKIKKGKRIVCNQDNSYGCFTLLEDGYQMNITDDLKEVRGSNPLALALNGINKLGYELLDGPKDGSSRNVWSSSPLKRRFGGRTTISEVSCK